MQEQNLTGQTLHLAGYGQRIRERLQKWQRQDAPRRVWQKDPTFWFQEPQSELVDRLGWLDLPEGMKDQLDDLAEFAEGVKNEGMQAVVLMGMGGSSLAPEVYQRTFGNAPGYPELHVLDSTHPAAVTEIEKSLDLSKTLFLVSSKSGTTIEAISFMHYFWHALAQTVDAPGNQFAAVTDPGTSLEQTAHEFNFRRVFNAPPDIGGRYSALSVFGLVPAALIGMDLHKYLEYTRTFSEKRALAENAGNNEALELGAALGELALAGRNKLTFTTSPALAAFPDWVEQLVAESTGKEGTGIIPVVGEPLSSPDCYQRDRVFVHIETTSEQDPEVNGKLSSLENAGHPVLRFQLPDRYCLGQEMFRWEFAIATASATLGIHPFNQPDVELAKKLAKQAMQDSDDTDKDEGETYSVHNLDQVREALQKHLSALGDNAYIGLQAYTAPSTEVTQRLQQLRTSLHERTRTATTLGYGPRFLHSTGQLHKGGPKNAFFLQLIDTPEKSVQVPQKDYTFQKLVHAQASGDYFALKENGQPVLRINLGRDPVEGLRQLGEIL